MRQSAPPTRRALPAMPLDSSGPDDDDSPPMKTDRKGGGRFERPRNRWWRPASTAGRVLLLIVALVVLSGFAASAYLLKSYLDRDERFRITGAGNIAASGLTEISRAEMLPVFGEDIGRNIFFVPLSERRRQLEQLPWVERATVMRLLPDQIRVSVVERRPVAFVRMGQQIGLVDASGVLLTMPAAMMAQRHYSFPVVTGFDAHDPLASRKARMAVYQRLLAELDSNGQQLSEQISEIDLTDLADARVLMPEQGGDILAHFGEDQFLERYQRYKAHISEWRQQYPKLAAVDLRYEQQVVLEMAAGTNVAQATADEQSADTTGDAKPSDGQAADESPEKQPSGAKQAAEKGLFPSKKSEKHTSVAKATADPIGFMPGINPRHTAQTSFSVASKAPVDSAGAISGLKPGAAALAGQSRSNTLVKPGNAGSKPVANRSTRPINSTAHKNPKVMKASAAKAVKTKKRAEAKPAALNANRQKSAPTSRPVSWAGMGQ